MSWGEPHGENRPPPPPSPAGTKLLSFSAPSAQTQPASVATIENVQNAATISVRIRGPSFRDDAPHFSAWMCSCCAAICCWSRLAVDWTCVVLAASSSICTCKARNWLRRETSPTAA